MHQAPPKVCRRFYLEREVLSWIWSCICNHNASKQNISSSNRHLGMKFDFVRRIQNRCPQDTTSTHLFLPSCLFTFIPPTPFNFFFFFFCSGDRIGRAYQGWLFPSLLLLCVTKPTATSEPCKTEIIINKSETIINTKNWSTKVRSRKAECLTLSASCLKTNRLIFRIHVHSLSNCNEVTSLVWDIDLTVRVRCHRHLNSAGWATWV